MEILALPSSTILATENKQSLQFDNTKWAEYLQCSPTCLPQSGVYLHAECSHSALYFTIQKEIGISDVPILFPTLRKFLPIFTQETAFELRVGNRDGGKPLELSVRTLRSIL